MVDVRNSLVLPFLGQLLYYPGDVGTLFLVS